MMLEKSPSACNDFLLLAGSDAAGRAAEHFMSPEPYLYKQEATVVLHDQVDLSLPRTKVGSHELATFLLQKPSGRLLGFMAATQPAFRVPG